MKIYIASDHGGYELKSKILENYESLITNHELIDLGPFELNEDDDYPDYALKVAEKVANENNALGILICRSGNGMCIAANKVKGAYAALAFSKKHAEMARKDDNANIVCLDSDYEGENPVEIVKTFLTTEFAGMDTRHGRRFLKIKEIEDRFKV